MGKKNRSLKDEINRTRFIARMHYLHQHRDSRITQQCNNLFSACANYLHIEYTTAASRSITAAHDAGSDLQ